MVNVKDLKELTIDDLNSKLKELKEENFNLRFRAKMGQLENPLELRSTRRDIARVNTILKEKSKA